MKTTAQTLREIALKIVKHYLSDIDHDERQIEKYPGTPFIHAAREYGTFLFMHVPATDYPAKGETIPYLFGRANREHILDQFSDVLPTIKNAANGQIWTYYDGRKFHKINFERAEEITREYQKRTRQQWKNAEQQKNAA